MNIFYNKNVKLSSTVTLNFAVKGMLYHLQSKIEKDIKEKKRLIDQGNFTIKKALEINGNLKYKYRTRIKNI